MAVIAPPYKTTPDGVGDYSLTMTSGALTGVAANGPVWSMLWTSPTLICVLKRIKISLGVTTAYGTAQNTSYGLYFARSFTVADSDGTAATLTTNNGKLDTNYATTAMADMRIGTTDVITAGTRTLDAQPLDVAMFGTTALGIAFDEEFQFGLTPGRQEIILRPNEGVVLNNLLLMGATGVVLLRVTAEWSEIPNSHVK